MLDALLETMLQVLKDGNQLQPGDAETWKKFMAIILNAVKQEIP